MENKKRYVCGGHECRQHMHRQRACEKRVVERDGVGALLADPRWSQHHRCELDHRYDAGSLEVYYYMADASLAVQLALSFLQRTILSGLWLRLSVRIVRHIEHISFLHCVVATGQRLIGKWRCQNNFLQDRIVRTCGPHS